MHSIPVRSFAVRSTIVVFLALIWVLGIAAPYPGHAAIYTWRDTQGALHVSDKPPVPQGHGKPFVPQAGQRSDKPIRGTGKLFLWQVRSGKTTGYLLGTIHLGTKDLYPLDARIEEAFDASEVIAVEADTKNLTPEFAQLVRSLGTYPKGDSLAKHVSQKTLDMLRQNGMDPQLFGRLRPWLLGFQLEQAAYQKLGASGQIGLDMHFMNKRGKRRLVELESLEAQLRMLSKLPGEDKDAYLQKTMESLPQIEALFPRIIEFWRTGDAPGMEKMAVGMETQSDQDKRNYDIMIRDRNKTMAAGIEKLIKAGKPFFAMVGALHLVGADGVPALLKKRGYKVRQVGAGQGAMQSAPRRWLHRPETPAGVPRLFAAVHEPCPSRRWAVR